MKFRVGDKVLVTGGKDKGVKSEITLVVPTQNRVTVKGANLYTKHIKPYNGRAGERVRRERPLPVANVAILNEKGQVDRIGFKISKTGEKQRVFKKTGSVVPTPEVKKK